MSPLNKDNKVLAAPIKVVWLMGCGVQLGQP